MTEPNINVAASACLCALSQRHRRRWVITLPGACFWHETSGQFREGKLPRNAMM